MSLPGACRICAGLPDGFVVSRLAGELESVCDALDVELAMREQAWAGIERGEWAPGLAS